MMRIDGLPTGILTQRMPASDRVVAESVAKTDSFFEPILHDAGIPLAVLGMLVVFSALIVLIVVISLLPKLIAVIEGDSGAGKAKTSKRPVRETAPLPIAPIIERTAEGGLTPQLIAVIAAAVAEIEQAPVRIIRTRQLTPSELAWTIEGRMRHHASHRLQNRR